MAKSAAATNPYKILMIAPTSFFSDYGCSVHILEEARALLQRGHRLTLCTYRNGQDLPGLDIRRTPAIPFRERYEVGSSLHKVGFDFLLFWTVLITALRQRPDVLHGHMHEGALIGLLVGRLLRIPLVFDFQGSLTSEMMDHKFLRQSNLLYRPLRWLEQAIDRHAPFIITSSHNARQILIDQFGCLPQRVQAVGDCVDAEVFYPPTDSEREELVERRLQLGIPADSKVICYLGLLADYQGTDLLLQAAVRVIAQRPDAHFLVMGFPAVDHYRQLAAELGLAGHVTFTGKIPYQQARDLLAVGDLAVAPKLSATEGNGKILNYMAMGLPTVAFSTPVSHEYLGAKGIYAISGDPRSLADALLYGLSEPDSQQRGQALRHTAVEAFSWDRAARIILQAYDSVCRRRPAVV